MSAVQNFREKKLHHPVHKFVIIGEDGELKCHYCNHKFKNGHTGNIYSHIRVKHRKDSEELAEHFANYQKNRKKKIKSTRAPIIDSRTITVSFNVDEVKSGLVEICSVNMCSFNLLKCSGFSRILHPIIEESRKCLIPLSVQSEAVHEYSECEYSKMKNIVKKELKMRTFSLMVDATTTQNRSFFSICAQYEENGEIIVRTLAVRRFHDSTGIGLCNVIKSVLFEFDVSPAQIYTLTTDNESSILKCVRDTAVIQKCILLSEFITHLIQI